MLYVGCLVGVEAGALLAGASGLTRRPPQSRRSFSSCRPSSVRACSSSPSTPGLPYRPFTDLAPNRGRCCALRRARARPARVGPSVTRDGPAIPRVLGLGAVTMAVGTALARVGCHLTGCCAGRVTAGRIGVDLPNGAGVRARRCPHNCSSPPGLRLRSSRRLRCAARSSSTVPCSPSSCRSTAPGGWSSNRIESATAPAMHRGSMSPSPWRSLSRAPWS